MTDTLPEPTPRDPHDSDEPAPAVWRHPWFRALALLLVVLGLVWRCA